MDIDLIDPKFFMINCKHIVPHLSYESYLIEVINGSMFFRGKCSPLEQYKIEDKQSNGEDDVVSSNYSMDFKLLVDQDVMNAMSKNKPEVDYSKMSQGFILVKTKDSKVPNPSQNLLSDIMNLKTDDLSSNELSDTIKNLLRNLRKEKNLFIYYPYEFSSVTPLTFGRLLTNMMRVVLSYRTKEQPQKDTFVCIKANSNFLIYEWSGSQLVYRDRVPEILCSTYRDIKLYSVY